MNKNEVLMNSNKPIQSLIKEFFSNEEGNIFTVRYTPSPTNEEKNPSVEKCRFQEGVLKLLKQKKLINYILAQEISKKGILHYHFRFTTNCSRDVVRKWRTKYFIDSKYQGQTYYVLHTCKLGDIVKDDTLWKSATYTCKDGDIVSQYGFTVSQIADLIAYGNQLKTSKSEPLWRRIISRSRLQQDESPNKKILEATEDFYKSLNKPLPSWAHLKTSIHNMKYTLQSEYREDVRNLFLTKMENMSQLLSNY